MLSPEVRKFGKKYITNKKDLKTLEFERSENQNLFGGQNDGVQFTMFLSCNITLSNVSCVQIWIDSAYMALNYHLYGAFQFVYIFPVFARWVVLSKSCWSCAEVVIFG